MLQICSHWLFTVCVEVGGDKASSHSTTNFKRCGGQNWKQEASIAGVSDNKIKDLPSSENRCHLHFIRTQAVNIRDSGI